MDKAPYIQLEFGVNEVAFFPGEIRKTRRKEQKHIIQKIYKTSSSQHFQFSSPMNTGKRGTKLKWGEKI